MNEHNEQLSYESFREQYEQQHPASMPHIEGETNEYPLWLQPITLVMFVAVSIVSGAHTTSTVRQTLEASLIASQLKDAIAFAAFFGFELALFVSVFSWLRSKDRWLSYSATFVVFVVIVLANVRDVARSIGSDDWFTTLIVIGVGVGTPLVALLSGKLFVDIYRTNRQSGQRAKTEYQEALKQWDTIINRAWTAYQKQQGKMSTSVQRRVRTDSADSASTGYGYNRTTDAKEVVRTYLDNNPDAYEMSVRKLADILEVGKSTVADVKKEKSNGHAN